MSTAATTLDSDEDQDQGKGEEGTMPRSRKSERKLARRRASERDLWDAATDMLFERDPLFCMLAALDKTCSPQSPAKEVWTPGPRVHFFLFKAVFAPLSTSLTAKPRGQTSPPPLKYTVAHVDVFLGRALR